MVEDSFDIAVELVRADKLERAWYAYGLLLASLQARLLGLERISVAEFGVAAGDGLLNLCKLTAFFEKTIGMKYRIAGFDSGQGLPAGICDCRDHPELWRAGDFTNPDVEGLRAKLPPNASLILGDVKDTVAAFRDSKELLDAPLGFVAMDLDLYSSTKQALNVFIGHARRYLPAVVMYVDDIEDLLTWNSWCGEKLALDEFNREHTYRKIEKKLVRRGRPREVWHEHFHFVHVLDHAVRTGQTRCKPLEIDVNLF